jgi:hypothetical protein
MDEDPIGPFEPLDEGKFSFREQLVYLGNNHALDYSATTGEFEVYRYDRGATLREAPFTKILASGKMDKNLQLTYIGEMQVTTSLHFPQIRPTKKLFTSFFLHAERIFLNFYCCCCCC